MGYPRGWEPGQMGNKFCNIGQSIVRDRKSTQRQATLRKGAGTGSTR